MIVSTDDTIEEKLVLINNVERLGVAYHFSEVIEEQILSLYNEFSSFHSDDLHVVALYFRVLRQHGFHISSGN